MAKRHHKGSVAAHKVVHAQYLCLCSVLQGIQLHISSQRPDTQLGCYILFFTVMPCTA